MCSIRGSVATCRSYANDAQLGLDQPEEGLLPEAFLDDLCMHVQVQKRQRMAMQSRHRERVPTLFT